MASKEKSRLRQLRRSIQKKKKKKAGEVGSSCGANHNIRKDWWRALAGLRRREDGAALSVGKADGQHS